MTAVPARAPGPRILFNPGAQANRPIHLLPGPAAATAPALVASQSQVVQIATNPMLQSSPVPVHASTVTTPSLGGAPIITSVQGAPVNPPIVGAAAPPIQIIPLPNGPMAILPSAPVSQPVLPPTLNNLQPPISVAVTTSPNVRPVLPTQPVPFTGLLKVRHLGCLFPK